MSVVSLLPSTAIDDDDDQLSGCDRDLILELIEHLNVFERSWVMEDFVRHTQTVSFNTAVYS